MIDRELDAAVQRKENLIREIRRKDNHVKRLVIKNNRRYEEFWKLIDEAREIIRRMDK
jgi:hypothetical protein